MVEFREISFGEREMIAQIASVHKDEVGKPCPKTGREPKSSQLHFVLVPSKPENWKEQNWWLFDTMASGSSWHDAVKQFKRLEIITEDDISDAKSNLDLAKKIVEKADGKSFRFIERRLGRALKPNWFPESVVKK